MVCVSRFLPLAAGSAAMTCVGGSVAVSAEIADAPLFTSQSIRYAVACLLLIGFARLTRAGLVRPRGAEWLWRTGRPSLLVVIVGVGILKSVGPWNAARSAPKKSLVTEICEIPCV